MSSRLPDELQAKLKADIDSYYEARKRELVQALELEHQKALEDFDRWVRGEVAVKDSPQIPSLAQEAPALPQEGATTRNGSSSTPTTRQMVLEVMPTLQNDTFTQGDIREKILERWSNIPAKNLQTRISQVLKRMYEEGKLERVEKGPRIQDPWIYREQEKQEEELLEP